MKEFRGHTSYVNDAIFISDEGQVITSFSDCPVNVWDVKTIDCIQIFKPPPPLKGGDVSMKNCAFYGT